MRIVVGQLRAVVRCAEGLLDALAGDLVVARYAVSVDGQQNTHAVPGAGGDLGRRGTGGQPQRQCRMT
jgi:hypothetical protein